MSTPRLGFALLLVLGCPSSGAPPTTAPAATTVATAATQDVPALDWLVGSWSTATPQGDVVERWRREPDGTLVGHSETRKGDQMVFFEDMRIEFDAEHRATFLASPMGRMPATAFPETTPRAVNRLVVENRAHDFPQRIVYERSGDSLLAHIEGQGQQADWTYQGAVPVADR